MRSLYTYSFLALTFAAVAGAQIVLDPSPARVIGHPSISPAEQLVVTNINPNFGVNGGLYSPEGVAVDTTGSTPILYVADTGNNRILAWKNATSSTLANLQPPDLIIGQPNSYTTLQATNGGLDGPTGLLVDAKGNLYVADSGNNRVLRYPSPFANSTTVPDSASPIDNKADIVLGQPDMFTSRSSNQGGNPSASTLSLSINHYGITVVPGLAMDSSGNLYVSDAGNNRVLQYPAASLTAGAVDPAAAIVIGQASFTVFNAPSGVYDRSTLYTPAGLAFDSAGHLFVADTYFSRLMVFTPPLSNGMAASRLAGIVDPAPSTATASTLHGPEGLVMINNGPAVLDAGDNRLLVFDPYSSPDWGLTSGDTTFSKPPPVALAVLGQGSSLTNFTSVAANAGNAQAAFTSNGATIATFATPSAAAIAGTDLFVVDTRNNRVLVYPNAGQAAAATEVLGQSGFFYNSPNSIHGKEFFFSSSSGSDAGIAVDSSTSTPHLYVSDPNNSRVLGFADARKVGPGVTADIVIGEPDMSTGLCNFGGVTNPPGTEVLNRQPTQSSLCYPTGLAVDPASGDLYVADSANGRVLRFPAPFAAANSSQQANLVLGQAGFTGISNPKASQSVMVFPYGLVFDAQRGLLVSDQAANRVLLFSMVNPTNGEPASTVIGQSNFTSTSSTVLNAPHHIAEDTIAELYVADTGHSQIAIFAIPTGTSTNIPVGTFTGLSSPEAVWVNQNPVVGPTNDIWVGDSSGLSRYTPLPVGATTETPVMRMPAAEVTGPIPICSGSLCVLPAIAITQDSFGALYVADTTNRVAIHYPALAGENGASFVCAMGCNLGTLTAAPYYLAPGAYASLFAFSGSFASSTTSNTVLPVPTTLGGVQVLVNGLPSPITYVSPTQINFVVPFEAPTSGTAQVAVVNPSTSQVLGSGSMTMNVAAPGFFIIGPAAGTTPAAGQIAALNCNKIVNGGCDNAVNGTANPANPGSTIQLFLTGQGAALTPSAPLDGQGECAQVKTESEPVVIIGTTAVTNPAYSGLAPCLVGLWQINVQIPMNPGVPAGSNFPNGVFPVLVNYQGLVTTPSTNAHTYGLATTIVINAP
jgi:uncharacterized protein (TIGR03437 family)